MSEMNQEQQFDDETKNSVDYQFYDKNLKILQSQNELLWKMNANLNNLNSKLSVIIFIMLLPLILIIISLVLSLVGGAGLLHTLFNM